VDFSQVLDEISNASIFWIFIFIIVSLFSHYIRALRWKVILHSVKPDIKIKHLFGSIMVGYGVNCVIPRFGEITRAILIGRWERLSSSSMFGAVIVERIIDLIFLGIAFIISLAIWSNDLSRNFPFLVSALYFMLAGMGILILFIILLIRFQEKVYGAVARLIGKFSKHYADKTVHLFQMLLLGFASLKGIKNYAYTILLSFGIIFFYALNSYIGFFTIGMESIQPVDFRMGWVLMSISAVGVVIPTPGGTGSYHLLATNTLVWLFGFNEVLSLSYATLTHGISVILFILAAVISFLILNKRHESLLKVVDTEVDEL
jgi:glycosyltransferase 2 family protein